MTQLDVILNMEHQDFLKYSISQKRREVNTRRLEGFQAVEYMNQSPFGSYDREEGQEQI